MDKEKTLAEVLVNNLIAMTVRAVKAENLEEALRANIEAARDNSKFWQDSYDRIKARLDATEKEVEKLRSRLNTYEGLEAAEDRGLI